MLVDVQAKTDATLDYLAGGDAVGSIVRHRRGVYEIRHFNFVYMLPGDESAWSSYAMMPGANDDNMLHPYGVCDSPDQFMEALGNALEEDAGSYVVSLTIVRKSDQSPSGGWRWHKWGPYIGKQKPDGCEYLFDESAIEEVYCYHVLKRIS